MKNKLSGFFLPNADVASFFCLVDSLAGYNFASIKCFSSGTMNITLVSSSMKCWLVYISYPLDSSLQ